MMHKYLESFDGGILKEIVSLTTTSKMSGTIYFINTVRIELDDVDYTTYIKIKELVEQLDISAKLSVNGDVEFVGKIGRPAEFDIRKIFELAKSVGSKLTAIIVFKGNVK